MPRGRGRRRGRAISTTYTATITPVTASVTPATASVTPAISSPTLRLSQTPTPAGRVRFSELEKVELIHLCIVHQADHCYGNKKACWSHIGELLQQKIGKHL